MSLSAGTPALSAGEAITVLHIDDDPDVLDLTATFLEREDRRFEVVTETRPDDALERLDGRIDCVVSDYQMPEMDGLAFLDAVREEAPELPFILFTGKGSEEIASDAISAGVTDYLQKGTGTDQYEILANRLVNAVDRHRTAREHARVHAALETATEGIGILNEEGEYVYVNETYAELYGLSRDELVGESWEMLYPDTQVERFTEEILPTLAEEGEWSGRGRGLRADGSTFVEQLSLTDLSEGGHVCVVRDITDRVERERQLQRERDRASALFENMAEAIAYYEFEDGDPLVRDLNPAFEETFGVDASEATGQPLDDIVVPPEHTDEGERINERVRAGEIVDREVVRRAGDGLRTFKLLSVPLRPGESGERGFAVYTDISARKAYERELEQYRTLVETVGDPMYMLDAAGSITMVNDAVVEQWGYSREELLEMHARDVMPEEDYERGTGVIQELLADADRSWEAFEMRSITADGETLVNENKIGVIVEDGEFVGSVGVLRDITERKEREQKLQESRERYQSLFENNPLVIWEEDSSAAVESLEEIAAEVDDVEAYLRDNPGEIDRLMADIEIIDVNRNALSYYDAPSKEALTDNLADLFAEETYEMLAEMWAAIADGETRFRGESVARSLDGERRNELVDVFVPEAYADDYSRMYVSGTDITERKERERELERKNERLEEFTSIVSHDLRNPLNVASSRLELAAEECDSSHLERVADAHERMETLIEDLLTLAREGETVADFEPVDLGDLLSGCWETLGRPEATLAVETDATVRADRDRLRQLVENLLANAVEHGGPDVTVTVGDCEGGFYVADDGPGIPAVDRADVFDAGYSTSQEGTGFGLSIVARIADAHGWSVAVTESPEGGARFEITGVETAG